MNIAELVFQALSSGSDGLRAFQNRLPQSGAANYVLPALVITTVAGADEMTLVGADGLRRRLIQLDAWGSSRKFADDYMELARTRMLAGTGFKVGAIDQTAAPQFDDEANLFRASLEFSLWFAQ